ncbi:MAG: hypothetical protein KDD66_17235 [Bdellovibrionales bacterium]|nr:hypothetical protein [Bdellovibrionales bacterium]
MNNIFKTYEAVSASAGFALCSEAAVVRVSGPDSPRYLQGRITQDIKQLEIGTSPRSMLLSPQGKIQGIFWIAKLEDSFLLASLRTSPDVNALIKALLLFKVADQVEAAAVEYSVIDILGRRTDEILSSLKTPHYKLSGSSYILCETSCLKEMQTELQSHGAIACPGEVSEMFRIQRGEPLYGVDVTERNGAPDLDVSQMVSFNKGCYTGQEVVEMSTARGKPNKQLVTLEGNSQTRPAVESDIVLENDGSRVGQITSCASYPGEPSLRCLGYIKASALSAGSFSADSISLTISPRQ